MITVNNENLLRTKCEDVKSLEEANDLILLLESELNLSNKLGKLGIGLAAPQIGVYKKAAIIRCCNININLINCKVKKIFDQVNFNQEGCLSFPNRLENTIRYNEIMVTGNLVYPNSFIATGMVSIVCQHEIDHFSGILFMDRARQKVKTKMTPNDICFCGSNKKYKRCCGINEKK